MKNIMTTMFCCLMVMAAGTILNAQEDKASRPSPPVEVKGKIGKADIMIAYGAPSVKGRKIWGELVPFGKIWRTGANEATIFETSAEIKINGSVLPAGKYALFTIPGETTWTVIFNSASAQWGTYQYDASKDVLKVEATPEQGDLQEQMLFAIEGNTVVLSWEKLRLPLKVK